MGLIGQAFGQASDDKSEKKGVVASVFGGIVSAQKSAIAANHAADMLDEKKTGLVAKTVDFVADTAGDVANIATFGVSRRVTNAVAGALGDEDKHLDYKALTAVKKEAKADGEPLTIDERAEALAGLCETEADELEQPGG